MADSRAAVLPTAAFTEAGGERQALLQCLRYRRRATPRRPELACLVMKVILAAAALLALGACAKPETLSAKPPDLAGIDLARGPGPSYRDAITVASVGVSMDTGTPWTSAAGPAQVQEALVQTLVAARLASAGNGRFRLDAVLLTLQRPYAGFAMTVTATIGYRLTEVATGAVVYTTTVTTPGTATLDDAYMSDTRLRIADERAIRANFRTLVEALYALPDRGPLTSSRRT